MSECIHCGEQTERRWDGAIMTDRNGKVCPRNQTGPARADGEPGPPHEVDEDAPVPVE